MKKFFKVIIFLVSLSFLGNLFAQSPFGNLLNQLKAAGEQAQQANKIDENKATGSLPKAEGPKNDVFKADFSNAKYPPPQSPKWQSFYKLGLMSFYFDPSLIKSEANTVLIPVLADLPKVNGGSMGMPKFKSVISILAIDCSKLSPEPKKERYWAQYANYFYIDSMGLGNAVLDNLSSNKVQWIEGFEGRGLTFEGNSLDRQSRSDGVQTNQAYLLIKELNYGNKICKTYWNASGAVAEPEKVGLRKLSDNLKSSGRADPISSQINFDPALITSNDDFLVMKIVTGYANDNFKKHDFKRDISYISEGFTLKVNCPDHSYVLLDRKRYSGPQGSGQETDVPLDSDDKNLIGTHFIRGQVWDFKQNFPDFCKKLPKAHWEKEPKR